MSKPRVWSTCPQHSTWSTTKFFFHVLKNRTASAGEQLSGSVLICAIEHSGSVSKSSFNTCFREMWRSARVRLGMAAFHTSPLEDAAMHHYCYMCSSADDSQIYIHCRHNEVSTAAARLESCICEIGGWIERNWLTLNPSETELPLSVIPHGFDKFSISYHYGRLVRCHIFISRHDTWCDVWWVIVIMIIRIEHM